MNKLIYKGNLNDFKTFAGVGVTKGNWNERALKYFQYLGATSNSFNTAQKEIEEANLETLRLDFVNQDYAVGSADTGAVETKDTFDDILTFSRGSTGTYYDSAGVLQTAAVDEPRFTHDPVTGDPEGLLIEEQRTNLLLWSEAFDDAAWVKLGATISADSLISPDGNLTTDKIVEDTSTVAHRVIQNVSINSGQAYTFSFFAKSDGRTHAYIRLNNSSGDIISGNVRLSDATVTEIISGSITAESVGNGVVRIKGTGTSSVTETSGIEIRASNSDVYANYTGDGTSGIYVWGAQLEQDSFPTSYIKTEGSQVTRSADNCSRTLGSEFNASEGVLYYEAVVTTAPIGNQIIAGLSDGGLGVSNSFSFLQARDEVWHLLTRRKDNTAGIISTGISVTQGAFLKCAISYDNGSVRLYLDGVEVAQDSNVRSNYQFIEFCQGTLATTSSSAVSFENFLYYPRALSATELQELTA